MYINADVSYVRQAFATSGNYQNCFSYDGIAALVKYFEDLELEMGEPIEFDLIAMACDFTEESIDAALESYNVDSTDELADKVDVIWIDGDNVLYRNS